MSHVTEMSTKFEDLDALEKAVEELGGKLHRNQRTFAWWGSFVDDSTEWKAMFSKEEAERISKLSREERKEIIQNEMKKCNHAISFPECKYEIGVQATDDGRFRLRYDEYSTGGLVEKIGRKGGKLAQRYGIERASRLAQKKRLKTRQVVMANGEIKLIVEGM